MAANDKISKYFRLYEMSVTEHREVDNSIPPSIMPKIVALANNMLDRVRELWGCPIRTSSVYRSPELNTVVGGATNSQHCRGEAADLNPDGDQPLEYYMDLLVESSLPWDEAIIECNKTGHRWIHVSYTQDRPPRHKALVWGPETNYKYVPYVKAT